MANLVKSFPTNRTMDAEEPSSVWNIIGVMVGDVEVVMMRKKLA